MNIQQNLNDIYAALDSAESALREARARASEVAQSVYPELDSALFKAFLKEPYTLIHRRAHEWYCVVPRFVDFSVGWLERTTESYNIFLINRHTLWLGDVPEAIRAVTGLEQPPGDLQIVGNQLVFTIESRAEAEQYKAFLSDPKSGRITRGKEFQLLARMIDDGYLPFVPRAVAAADRRDSPLPERFFVGKYSFQREAYDEFMQRGAVGVYWMTGAGKSYLSMAVLDSLKGQKVIVVPTRTLVEQWKDYFRKHASRLSHEVEVIVYNSYEKISRREWAITIFDECHRLPAATFSRLATIKTKYRIGLSASPYREDNKTSYIFALTGYPIGMDWRSLVTILGKEFHTVTVWIVANQQAKLTKIEQLLNPSTKTLIFSDGLAFGTRIATRFNLPFIHGGSSKRIDTAKTSTAFVASRVMDMGVSLDDLEHIIEADFLYGSRQQEIQRTGRLFHSESKSTRHDILMTREEFELYQKRLRSLVEKGFKVNIHS